MARDSAGQQANVSSFDLGFETHQLFTKDKTVKRYRTYQDCVIFRALNLCRLVDAGTAYSEAGA